MAARLFLLRGARSVACWTRQESSVRLLAATSMKVPPLTDAEKDAIEKRFEHDYHGDEDKEMYKWKKISFFVVVPFLVVMGFYITVIDHEPHVRPKFKPYEHIRIYRKPLPWRDGTGPMLFNRKMVATKDGYLTEPPSH